VQQLEELDTLDGLELAELRELVMDGAELRSDSQSESSESSRLAYPKRWVSSSTVAVL
jgi:hypothetical protein